MLVSPIQMEHYRVFFVISLALHLHLFSFTVKSLAPNCLLIQFILKYTQFENSTLKKQKRKKQTTY